MAEKQLLPVVTGPTASGKTACAVYLARKMGGEVISADSMQVFQGMEILSAAPTMEERQGIPHHMIGVAPPTQPFSASIYREQAVECIRDMVNRGKQPILCGGTGLYIDALTRPMSFSQPGDEALRQELHAIADEPGGRQRLHRMLAECDPASAARLHPNDLRRVVRAIEVYRLTGISLTEHNRRDHARQGDYDERIFALEWPRDALYARIDRRVEQMLKAGLLKEVRALMRLEKEQPTAVQAIGYKEIAAALRGETTLAEGVARMQQASRNYAKRQITWLKRDGRTQWIPAMGRSAEEITQDIYERIERK